MAARTMGVAFEVGRQDAEVSDKPSSFLNPVGETAKEVPPKAIGAKMELVIFFFFVLVRAAHPVVIDSAKVDVGDGKMQMPFSKVSPVIVMTVSLCILNLIFCWAVGGTAQFMSIFEKEPFMIFSINGAIYALGDYLEMGGIEGIPATAYQILQQFRIVLTALLLIPVKGQYQTRMQWTILSILMFAMCTYMAIEEGKKAAASGPAKTSTGSDALIGTLMSIAKVVVSCLGAVITDKYMKKYSKDPTHVCIARTFVARAIFIVILSFFLKTGNKADDPMLWAGGFTTFFQGWDFSAILVTISFIIKSVSTIYIVALLDSILKNIAEAGSVLLIYGYAISPMGNGTFDAAAMMAVLVVVASCGAYIDSKSVVEKAAKYDAIQSPSA